jgi:hypothetical protein
MKPPDKGFFVGDAVTKWLDNGRDMQLIASLSFVDRTGKVWHAPAGSVVNGASIPRAVWFFIGSPFCGRYRRASIIHDVYCPPQADGVEVRPWRDVHNVFSEMMQADHVAAPKRWIMRNAVYHFGPRW